MWNRRLFALPVKKIQPTPARRWPGEIALTTTGAGDVGAGFVDPHRISPIPTGRRVLSRRDSAQSDTVGNCPVS